MTTSDRTDVEVPEDLVRRIKAVLHQRLEPYGLDRVDVFPTEDHDGDPILMVEAHYAESDRGVDSRETYAAGKDIRRIVREMGETRFPHIRHLFAENQKVPAA